MPLVVMIFEERASEKWRYALGEQLRRHANSDGFVLLTAVNFVYRNRLMNFKCNMERVGMTDNFVVAALDKRMYVWGILQKLVVRKTQRTVQVMAATTLNP
jgi:hypothetical protein